MLVLTRKKGQSIMIGNDIEISLVDIQGDQVRIGINAPKNVTIHRKEIFEEIKDENRLALANNNMNLSELTIKLKHDKSE